MSAVPLLCLPLDGDARAARSLVRTTKKDVDVFKIGLTSFAAGGPDLAREVAATKPLFLDLKLHDIPAQVEGAVGEAGSIGAAYLTVHAAGGRQMIKSAVAAAGPDMQILVVTVLTSLGNTDLNDLGLRGTATKVVLRLAALALDSGATGLVCSSNEIEPLRKEFGERAEGGPLLVVPGIRPQGAALDDQQRTATPAEAARRGADVLVVGRAITRADDPAAAARRIKREMAG